MQIKRIGISESELVIGLFDKYRVFYKQKSDLELAGTFIQARLKNNESVIFVALAASANGTIPVGFTQLYPTYSSARAVKNWILNDLYVEESFRKQGAGKRLIETAMNFAKEDGTRVLQLETAVTNHTAQKLYEAIGFIKQSPGSEFLLYKIDVSTK